MFSENFYSPMVRWHYSSAQQQALSFLQTIGAKALVVTDSRPIESAKLIGLNEEAQMRRVIVSQERIRSIRRNIVERVPLTVWKCARSGEVRPVDLTIRSEGKKRTFIEWKSKLSYVKKFEVDVGTVVNCQLAGPQAEYSTARFKNRKRFLDLQFRQKMELEAFVLVLQSAVPGITVIL